MTGTIEHTRALAALLEARMAFRKRWVQSFAYRKKTVSEQHIAWPESLDEESNFARMGAETVDADWGIPKPKAKKRKRADAVRAFAVAA